MWPRDVAHEEVQGSVGPGVEAGSSPATPEFLWSFNPRGTVGACPMNWGEHRENRSLLSANQQTISKTQTRKNIATERSLKGRISHTTANCLRGASITVGND